MASGKLPALLESTDAPRASSDPTRFILPPPPPPSESLSSSCCPKSDRCEVLMTARSDDMLSLRAASLFRRRNISSRDTPATNRRPWPNPKARGDCHRSSSTRWWYPDGRCWRKLDISGPCRRCRRHLCDDAPATKMCRFATNGGGSCWSLQQRHRRRRPRPTSSGPSPWLQIKCRPPRQEIPFGATSYLLFDLLLAESPCA